jgi:hypothetical protein
MVEDAQQSDKDLDSASVVSDCLSNAMGVASR